uniref:Uncharacterized protein n=1 Tax=Hordeum vulgare subsp. vulgare TaxID=112509 RepID=A0A8I6Y4K0_HORVV
MGADGEALDPGEERDGAPDAAVVGGREVVVAEHDAAGAQHGPCQVDVRPRRVEVVAGVHLDEVRVDAPPAQRPERGRRGEGQRQHRGRGLGPRGEHVGHELWQQQSVAVALLRDVAAEAAAEGRPAAEVVHAEDGREQREVPGHGRHVQRRCAQERAQLHDHVRPHLLDQLREHRPRRPPPARPRRRRVQQRRGVRRREARVRALAVEQLIKKRLHHVLGRHRLPALVPEPEQVVRRRARVARARAVRRGGDAGGGSGEVRGVRPYDSLRRLGRGRAGGRRDDAERVANREDDEEGGDPREVRPEPGRHARRRRCRRRRTRLHDHARTPARGSSCWMSGLSTGKNLNFRSGSWRLVGDTAFIDG